MILHHEPPRYPSSAFLFFFNDTATTEIYTLSLHDALPISYGELDLRVAWQPVGALELSLVGQNLLHARHAEFEIGKSTRLNSSHSQISYAVFCLKKKKQDGAPRAYQ